MKKVPVAKKVKAKLNLDIGCGENLQPGFVGMDIRPLPGVDIVHDAEVLPWPIKSSTVSVILMSHMMEHIKPWYTIPVMNEMWRILEIDGLLIMSMPYAGSFRYWQDPTHCNGWNEATVEYFLPANPMLYGIYKPSPWKLEKRVWLIDGDLEIAMRKTNFAKIEDVKKKKRRKKNAGS